MAETVEDYLARSLIKDSVKGGGGWRSVREVASVCVKRSPKMDHAARELIELEKTGKAELAFWGDQMFFRSTLGVDEARNLNPTYIP